MTFACNLRCGFCYTDSPRHTLARTAELSDEEWLRIADELVEIGAIEAVVTGGEPLLRRELTIEVCQRLAAAGLGVTLNSNGWSSTTLSRPSWPRRRASTSMCRWTVPRRSSTMPRAASREAGGARSAASTP